MCSVGPIDRDGGGVGNEELVKGDAGVDADEFFAHAWEGQMVYPGGMRGEKLAGAWCDPVRETVVGFLGGANLPAHDYEHYVPML